MHLLLPGLSKCVVVYYSASDASVISRQMVKPGIDGNTEKLDIEDSALEHLKKLRNTKDSYNWLNKSEVPFEVETEKIIQMDVFSELEKNILLLSLPNDLDKKKDLIFCYFNENFSNFKISKSDKPLSTENKTIIGILLYNSINSFLNILKSDSSNYISVNTATHEIIESFKKNENRLNSELNEKNEMIIAYLSNYLDELGDHGKCFRFSEKAISKIIAYNGDLGKLKRAVRKAATYLTSVNYGINEKNLVIEDFLLSLDESSPKNEKAAQKLILENKVLTSANVGNALVQPVTAPAISDAIKKHKGKIISLIKENPDKWRTIKTEFRPLLNILTSRQNDSDMAGEKTG